MGSTFTAEEIFDNEYGGDVNFMTPRILKRGKLAFGVAYELSEGNGIGEGLIWGLTVVFVIQGKPLKTQRAKKLSQCFHSKDHAEYKIQQLKQFSTISLMALDGGIDLKNVDI